MSVNLVLGYIIYTLPDAEPTLFCDFKMGKILSAISTKRQTLLAILSHLTVKKA